MLQSPGPVPGIYLRFPAPAGRGDDDAEYEVALEDCDILGDMLTGVDDPSGELAPPSCFFVVGYRVWRRMKLSGRVTRRAGGQETYVFRYDLIEGLGQHRPIKHLHILLNVPWLGGGEVHDLLEELLRANLILGDGLRAETLQVPTDPVLLLDVEDVPDEALEEEDDVDGSDAALRHGSVAGTRGVGGTLREACSPS
ncbi:hypothetical protein NUW54_g12965 [Trametes sanguinea]|uniref:Uncharacterized protein n=1 Tax=Trametes sanguinea TaxID=158606 RepID=A0ACC1MSV0_9APHY|nr:hypothetical protein NUW54_g12965 [Trametes sanguinea]